MPQTRSSKYSYPRQIFCQLKNLAATGGLADRIAMRANEGDVIALVGPIGAGKTTFARLFITAAGYSEDVPSPTFNLVQVYEGAQHTIWHFDLYRLERPEDVFELGIEQAFDEGITLIEWPERMGELLPPEALILNFKPGPSEFERQIHIDIPVHWEGRLGSLELSESGEE